MSSSQRSADTPLQFAVSGYYGCGNAGDEAVLAGIQEAFARRAGDRVRLLALSQDPQATTALHGIPAIDRMRLSGVRRTLRQCDLLLSGGGSLLQDTTSVRSLLYYLLIARMALSARVPVMFYAQGLGPLRRPLSRALVRRVADRAAYITVRDPASAQLLRDIGVRNPRIEVTADPAFALSPAPDDAVDSLMQAARIPIGEPAIAVALRPWGAPDVQRPDHYARLLLELEQASGMRVVLLPMQSPGDVAFAERVAAQTGAPERFPIVRAVAPPAVLLGLIARMQVVVAMRLHALIFAARMAVPPFALAYDPKVNHLMQSLKAAEAVADWRDFDPAHIASQVKDILSDRPARIAALRALIPELEQFALHNASCALKAVTGG